MKKIFLLILMCLTACANTPTVIVHEKVIYKALPGELFTSCSVTVPPDPVIYANAKSDLAKEDILTKYIIAILSDLNICNHQIQSIKSIDVKQAEIYATSGVRGE